MVGSGDSEQTIAVYALTVRKEEEEEEEEKKRRKKQLAITRYDGLNYKL
jgi:hypothetical protein